MFHFFFSSHVCLCFDHKHKRMDGCGNPYVYYRLLLFPCASRLLLQQHYYSVFGLRNEVIHLLLTPHFFIWFVE
jgi:hypothetical protein